MDYFVSWDIEVTAENPVEAARLALNAQRRPGARATVFQVSRDGSESAICVDLTAVAEAGEP